MTTIDKAALEAARERLLGVVRDADELKACLSTRSYQKTATVNLADLRLVIDALREAERGGFDLALERNALSKTLADTEAELAEVKTERVKLLATVEAQRKEIEEWRRVTSEHLRSLEEAREILADRGQNQQMSQSETIEIIRVLQESNSGMTETLEIVQGERDALKAELRALSNAVAVPEEGVDPSKWLRVGPCMVKDMLTERAELQAERDALKAEVERLREALQWAAQHPYAGGKTFGDVDPVRAALRGEEAPRG